MYLRHRSDFNRDFMTADPFADFDPTNDPIREQATTSYNCDWTGCPGEATAPGALCAKCQAEADACAPPEGLNTREQAIRNFFNR